MEILSSIRPFIEIIFIISKLIKIFKDLLN